MTLVELLVVVAIIGLLAVTVLPNLSNTAETRRTRETARAVSTWVSKAQSRAIGRTEWAGFWIIPVNLGAPYAAAIDLQLADVPEVYRGESLQSQVVTSAPTGSLELTWFLRNLQFNPALPPERGINTATWQSNGRYLDSVARGDLIRFDGTGPWFELVALSPPGTIGLLFPDLQRIDTNPADLSIEQGRHPRNPLNTAWPLEGVSHSYEILRQPVRTGATYTFADGRCIDLYWSGQDTSDGYRIFGNSGIVVNPPVAGLDHSLARPVAILFDATGRVREIHHRDKRVAVEGTIYLLVGRADRAGQPWLPSLNANDDSVGANWQYADSYWIAIDPNSGIAKVAEVAANAATVVDSQAFIRSQITAGGR
jgi:type II secretory pathway pseudopilin PulG